MFQVIFMFTKIIMILAVKIMSLDPSERVDPTRLLPVRVSHSVVKTGVCVCVCVCVFQQFQWSPEENRELRRRGEERRRENKRVESSGERKKESLEEKKGCRGEEDRSGE